MVTSTRLFHFALLLGMLSGSGYAQEEIRGRYKEEIRAFVALDEENPPPRGAVLFTGSSTVRLWAPVLEKEMAPLTVLARGFGGSTFDLLDWHLEHVVLKHRPRAVVIYSGENDISRGASAEETFTDFQRVLNRIRGELPDCRFYLLGIKPAPKRKAHYSQMQAFNDQVEAFADETENVWFLDTWEAMLDEEGSPDVSLFKADGVHLSEKGNRQWMEVLMKKMIPNELPNETRFQMEVGGPVSGPSRDALSVDEDVMRMGPTEQKRGGVWFRLPVSAGVDAGSPVEIRLTLRTRQNDGAEDGQAGQGGVVVRFGAVNPEKPEHNQLLQNQISSVALASADWQEIRIPFRNAHAFDEGGAVVQIERAYFDQTIEIRDVEVRVYPESTPMDLLQRTGGSYAGQESDAAWRTEAAERIRAHRMAPLKVKVVDAFGRPVEGAKVSVEMTRHAYLFGTCVKATRLIDADLASRREEFDQEAFLADNQRYRSHLKELFNFVVYENDMKWPQWWNEKGWADQAWTRESLSWLKQNGFVIKGHTMIWGSWRFIPERLQVLKDDPDALQAAILAHIRDLGMAVRGQVQYFDVLNEPMSHKDLIEIVGMDGVTEWFKVAREAMPGTKLVLNDFDLIGNGGSAKRRASFLAFVKELQDRGAPIDVIGFQSHFWSPKLTPPERMWEIMDEVHEATGLPLMVSEFDMNLNDEALQADYTRDFLTAWVAHPASEAYIMWGFWGGAHWMRDAGAMIRKDWTEKPNLEAYRNLVKRDWWTATRADSEADGTLTVPAFYGSYQITVEAPGHPAVQRQWEHRADGDAFWIQVF